jgi:hypothetical protein
MDRTESAVKRRFRQILFVLACAGGVLAALAGNAQLPLAQDEITAVALAQALRAREVGLLVIDTRPDDDSDRQQVPGAQSLADLDTSALPQGGTVVVYGEGDIDTTLLDTLRRQPGTRRYLRLRGGLRAWNADVMYPVLRSDASARQQAQFSAQVALSRYFGGTPRQLDPGTATPQARSRRGC